MVWRKSPATFKCNNTLSQSMDANYTNSAAIILIQPENSGNIGAIARVMKNFGFSKLILVSPKAEINNECCQRAKHAKEIILKAKKYDISRLSQLLNEFDIVIGTTGRTATDYNLTRSFIDIKEASDILIKYKNPAILFGREGKGLSNDELKLCDIVINIPTKDSVMNISHACAVALYELSKNSKIREKFNLASRKEKEKLLDLINDKLDRVEFETREKRETQKILWKRILGKTTITKREIQSMFGFFRKII